MALPVNQQNIAIMELFLGDVEASFLSEIEEVKERQKKELNDIIAKMDINKHIQLAFNGLTKSAHANEVLKAGEVQAIKWMIDVNDETINQKKVSV